MKALASALTTSLLGLGLSIASCSSDQATPAAQTGGSATMAGDTGAAGSAPSAGKPASQGGSGMTGGAGKAGSSGGGNAPSTAGGNSGTGGTPSAEAGAPGAPATSCDDPGLVWKSANKTNYESYPDPGSEECVEFNGCTWEGQFAACDGKKPEAWVMAHDIVAAFPDFEQLELHDLCLRKGDKTIVVTVLDTCGDSDCDGCCTENQGNAEQLIDVEKYTNQRWGVQDGRIEWADLGPTRGNGCD